MPHYVSTATRASGHMVSATPARLPSWFVPYTRWRFVGLPREFPGSLAKYPRPPFPRRITKEVQWVLDEWDRFALWSRWLDAGGRHGGGPRPIGLWVNAAGQPVSPGWAGDVRRLVHAHRTTPPVVVFPPPDVHPMPDTSFGRNWICMAQEPAKAQWYPARFGVAFTADRAYERPSAAQIEWHRDRHQRIAVWCDCHSTFPDEAKHVRSEIDADYVIGEGESAAAFQVALDAGLRMAWINLSALTGDQKDAIRTGRIIAVNELYLNQDRSRADRENWENLPIPGRLIATYDASREASTGGPFSFEEYVHLNKWSPSVDSFYDPGASDVDRRAVAAS